MNLIDIIVSANRNLFRNKARSILTIVAIFIGSFAIILNSGINTGVNSFIDSQVDSYGGEGALAIMAGSAASMMTSTGLDNSIQEYKSGTTSTAMSMTEADLDKIGEIDGVKSAKAMPVLNVEYITSEFTDKKYTLPTIETRASDTINIATETGTMIDDESEEFEVILSPEYIEALGFESNEAAIGEDVTLAVVNYVKQQMGVKTEDVITEIKAEVVGVQAPGVVTLSAAWANKALGDKIYNTYLENAPSALTERILMIEADVEPDKIESIKDELKEMGLVGTSTQDMVGAVKSFFNVIIIIFDVFGVIALIAAAIGIVNTLLMSVQERTREIGLNKAMGMSSGRIFLSFSIEAILLGFWGSALGLLIAMLVGGVSNAIFHQPGMFLEAFPTFNLTEFTVGGVLPIILIVMAIAFLAGTIPAVKAAKKDPIEALRYE